MRRQQDYQVCLRSDVYCAKYDWQMWDTPLNGLDWHTNTGSEARGEERGAFANCMNIYVEHDFLARSLYRAYSDSLKIEFPWHSNLCVAHYAEYDSAMRPLRRISLWRSGK
jgi:hypothetical protein